MTHDDYRRHCQEFLAEMLQVTRSKNPDYSAGTDDAMNDYKSAAARLGVTPFQAWAVLLTKHIHAVERFVKTGKLSSESIHSRLIDLANYAMLGDALVKDLARQATTSDRPGEVTQLDLLGDCLAGEHGDDIRTMARGCLTNAFNDLSVMIDERGSRDGG